MVHVRLTVSDGELDVSTGNGTWRSRVENTLAFRPDSQGRRAIVRIGDRGDQTGAPTDGNVVPAFDAADFDPDVSAAATRFWALEAIKAGHGRSMLRASFTRPTVDLVWLAWRAIPQEARRQYLRETVRFADVVVNGQAVARWSRLRRVLGLAPEIVA